MPRLKGVSLRCYEVEPTVFGDDRYQVKDVVERVVRETVDGRGFESTRAAWYFNLHFAPAEDIDIPDGHASAIIFVEPGLLGYWTGIAPDQIPREVALFDFLTKIVLAGLTAAGVGSNAIDAITDAFDRCARNGHTAQYTGRSRGRGASRCHLRFEWDVYGHRSCSIDMEGHDDPRTIQVEPAPGFGFPASHVGAEQSDRSLTVRDGECTFKSVSWIGDEAPSRVTVDLTTGTAHYEPLPLVETVH